MPVRACAPFLVDETLVPRILEVPIQMTPMHFRDQCWSISPRWAMWLEEHFQAYSVAKGGYLCVLGGGHM